jgi:hypothetical protein
MGTFSAVVATVDMFTASLNANKELQRFIFLYVSFFTGLFGSVCNECSNKMSNNVKIGGEIEYFGLQNWWMNDLTDEERNTIISIYQPFGLNKNSLIEGKITYSSQTAIAFLTGLLTWFKKPEYQKISSKIIKKIESLSIKSASVLDKHFFYHAKIGTFYRNRNTDESALSGAIEACKQQISISGKAKKAFLREYPRSLLPSHTGYNQLCIILEKQKNYYEVIRLALNAKKEGWAGDWDKRIERCLKKRDTN